MVQTHVFTESLAQEHIMVSLYPVAMLLLSAI